MPTNLLNFHILWRQRTNTCMVIKKEASKLVHVRLQCAMKPNKPQVAITVQPPFIKAVRGHKKCTPIPGMTDKTYNSELKLRLHTVITTRKCYLEPLHVRML
jgi:hypothetical protein